MAHNLKSFAAAILIAGMLSACATAPRNIETPTGPISGLVIGPYQVLGVADRATGSMNQANAFNGFQETVNVDAPAGTEVIVPVLRGWTLGYGSTNPADLTGQPTPESTFEWSSEDHNFGIGDINIAVVDIDALAPGATTQSAKVQVNMRLNDENSDDKWWGMIHYELIFLGRIPPPPR